MAIIGYHAAHVGLGVALGGSAWTRTPDASGAPGQWYLHLFAPEQPDWNWDNLEVREDFLTTLRFWADRGVDGFRVDVAHALAKDMAAPLRSKPAVSDELTPVDGRDPLLGFDTLALALATQPAEGVPPVE
jgi:alpha-glucosidase